MKFMRMPYVDEMGRTGEVELASVQPGDLVRFTADFRKIAGPRGVLEVRKDEVGEVTGIDPDSRFIHVRAQGRRQAVGDTFSEDIDLSVAPNDRIIALLLNSTDPRLPRVGGRLQAVRARASVHPRMAARKTLERLLQRFPQDADAIQQLAQGDPTNNHDWLEQMYKWYLTKRDVASIIATAHELDRFSRALKEKNKPFRPYDYPTVDAAHAAVSEVQATGAQPKLRKQDAKYTTIYNQDGIAIHRIENKAASCVLGSDSDWCSSKWDADWYDKRLKQFGGEQYIARLADGRGYMFRVKDGYVQTGFDIRDNDVLGRTDKGFTTAMKVMESLGLVIDYAGPTTESAGILEILYSHGERAYGSREQAPSVAQEWADNGFTAGAVDSWLDATVYDPDMAAALVAGEVSPNDLINFTRATRDSRVNPITEYAAADIAVAIRGVPVYAVLADGAAIRSGKGYNALLTSEPDEGWKDFVARAQEEFVDKPGVYELWKGVFHPALDNYGQRESYGADWEDVEDIEYVDDFDIELEEPMASWVEAGADPNIAHAWFKKFGEDPEVVTLLGKFGLSGWGGIGPPTTPEASEVLAAYFADDDITWEQAAERVQAGSVQVTAADLDSERDGQALTQPDARADAERVARVIEAGLREQMSLLARAMAATRPTQGGSQVMEDHGAVKEALDELEQDVAAGLVGASALGYSDSRTLLQDLTELKLFVEHSDPAKWADQVREMTVWTLGGPSRPPSAGAAGGEGGARSGEPNWDKAWERMSPSEKQQLLTWIQKHPLEGGRPPPHTRAPGTSRPTAVPGAAPPNEAVPSSPGSAAGGGAGEGGRAIIRMKSQNNRYNYYVEAEPGLLVVGPRGLKGVIESIAEDGTLTIDGETFDPAAIMVPRGTSFDEVKRVDDAEAKAWYAARRGRGEGEEQVADISSREETEDVYLQQDTQHGVRPFGGVAW